MGVLPLQEGQKLLSLTAVVYTEGDRLGQVLALASLLPVFIVVGYLTTILVRRELLVLSMLLGQCINELLNAVLKDAIQQPRPTGAPSDEWGMPSSHSQFMGFFCASVVAWALSRLPAPPPPTTTTTTTTTTSSQRQRQQASGAGGYGGVELLIGVVAAVASSVVVMYSRVYLGYHSVEQVLVGLAVGLACGMLWRSLTTAVLVPAVFPAVEALWLAQILTLHDASFVPNALAEGRATARRYRRSAAELEGEEGAVSRKHR
jgi:dolichyldiphosphatase